MGPSLRLWAVKELNARIPLLSIVYTGLLVAPAAALTRYLRAATYEVDILILYAKAKPKRSTSASYRILPQRQPPVIM